MDCFLVIPCLNEGGRLPPFLTILCKAIEASPYSIGIMVIDDGSLPEERLKVERSVSEEAASGKVAVQFKALEKNRGKGFAIRAAWATAPDSCRYLAFVDADGAVDPNGFLAALDRAMGESDDTLVVGSRRVQGKTVERVWRRQVMSALFLWLVKARYAIDVQDTQCGCKIVPRHFFRKVEKELKEEAFGLDLELLVKAKKEQVPIVEFGVDWREQGGSRLGLRRSFALFWDVFWGRVGR